MSDGEIEKSPVSYKPKVEHHWVNSTLNFTFKSCVLNIMLDSM